MTIHAVRRENETVEKLIHRFKKQVQGTRLVQVIRAGKHWTKKASKRLVRVSALKRAEYRAKRRVEQFSA